MAFLSLHSNDLTLFSGMAAELEPAQPSAAAAGTKLYRRRYLMLVMFVCLSASNALQWIEYSIIAHIITDFYDVSYDAVNWTSMIYMLMYMLLVFPGR